MALLQVTFRSMTLHRRVPLQVILPADAKSGGKGPFKTLYLLHGLKDDCTIWTAHTRIERWAMERELAVVMPSGENSFYLDNPSGNSVRGDFGTYLGRELVEMTRKMFPLSPQREDTFFAGHSMGGFGALRNGFLAHETFGYLASLSGALHVFEYPFDDPERNILGEDACFGDLERAVLSDKNPRVAAEAMFNSVPPSAYPKVYLACGTEDYLLKANRVFADFLRKNEVDLVYQESPGGHDWNYWDTMIQDVLDWLPLEKKPL